MTYVNFMKSSTTPMREVTDQEISLGAKDLKNKGISISDEDIRNGSPKKGDMIAMNPENPADKWLVSKEYFEKNYMKVPEVNTKPLDIKNAEEAKNKINDINIWGDGDTFKLISKASSKSQGWMKSTKAMEIEGVGVVVQVSTQQGDNVAEALTFIPGAKIDREFEIDENGKKTVVSRRIIKG